MTTVSGQSDTHGPSMQLRRIFGIVLSLSCFLLSCGHSARAQEDVDSRMLERWGVTLDWVELELDEDAALVSDFNRYETRLGALINRVEQFRTQSGKALETPQLELEALGPPPENGEPPEADDISKQRTTTNDEIATLSQRVKQSELILVRAEQLLKRLGTAQRQQLEARLLTRTPGIYTGQFWTTFLDESIRIINGLARDAADLLRGQRRDTSTGWLIVVLVLSAALTAIPGGRWLTRHFGRNPQSNKTSYSQRTLSAFAEGVASGLLPAAIIGGISLALVSQQLVGEQAMPLIKAVGTSIVVAIIILAPIKAALVPHAPNWRLVSVDSAIAARLTRRLQCLVGFCAALFALYLATERFRPYSRELDVVGGLAITLVIGTLFLGSLHNRFWRSAAAGPDETQPSWMLDLLRRALLTIVAFAMILGLAGYVDLSAFLVSRLAVTIVTVCTLLLVRRLLYELLDRVTTAWQNLIRIGREPQSSSMGLCLRGLLDLLLLGPALLLLSNAWGIPQAVIQLWSRRLFDGITIGELTFSPGRILLAILVFSIVFIASRLFRRLMYDRVMPDAHTDFGLRHSVYIGIGYLGIALAVILSMAALGVGLRNMALTFGALSVGIGLGMQSLVTNFISGLILLAQRPIRVGDWIEVGEYEGIVRNIMSVSTELETFDKASIIIPNADLVSKPLVNWTHADNTARIIITIGVSQHSNVDQVQSLLLQCASSHDDVLTTPEPYALFVDFAESSLKFELRVFISDAERSPIVSSQLRNKINQACRDADIEIPYPQQGVHLSGVDQVVNRKLETQ